jgi:hypothetical protein
VVIAAEGGVGLAVRMRAQHGFLHLLRLTRRSLEGSDAAANRAATSLPMPLKRSLPRT